VFKFKKFSLWLAGYHPYGQTATQIPQTLTFSFKYFSPNSLHFSRHLKASKNSSLSTEISHFFPLIAFAGHRFTQILQLPQELVSTGSGEHFKGVSVKIETSLNLGPKDRETKRSDLPIHPSPALVATILCDNLVRKSDA
jgi:hypothetical protein